MKFFKYFGVFVLFLISLSLFSADVKAYSIFAATDKITYAVNDVLTVSGTINTSSAVTVTETIYSSTGTIMDSSSATSSGGTPNTFSLSNEINGSYPAGNYLLGITDGSGIINLSFRVISQKMDLATYFINGLGDVIDVSTNMTATTANEDPFLTDGNLTELVNLSMSGMVHYGNFSVMAKTYHFVLVDQTNTSVYDRLYIDDDKRFNLYDDTEDAVGDGPEVEYQALKIGSMFSNGTFKYMLGEIERTTGNKLILFKPAFGKPPYSASDTVNFIVIAKNTTHLLSGKAVTFDIRNSSGSVTSAATYTTSDFGWLNASTTLPNLPAGVYVLNLNESLKILPFPVESFKLFFSTNDQSGNPTFSFAPNSVIRFLVTSINSSGSPINLTSFNITGYVPTGQRIDFTNSNFTQVADGIYRFDSDSTGAPTGRYSLVITGSDGTNTQTTSISFEIQSVNFEAQAINPRYIEEAESTGAMINAFPPGYNVSIMTFLTNISAGGMMSKGPEEITGLLTPDNCNSSLTLTSLKDENGVSYPVNYFSMNLSEAMNYLTGTPSELPPQEMLTQCMILFVAPNKTGTFRAEVKMNYQGAEKYSGVMFDVQRLYAQGATVDFKGDDFSYLSPNSTVRIKLKVRDLVTDMELDSSNIKSGKIIGMYRVYPSFKDILGNSTLRGTLNESITNGTISFISPNDEGFFNLKFRFVADVDGRTEVGTGDAFFMLKKYMVWGQLAGAQQGQWYVKGGQNITLTVTVMDIGSAQSVFGGYSSQKSCTGCSGFTIDVSEVRNEQQFKKVSGYTVLTGTITNSTNPIVNVTIVPSPDTDMQSGWYSVDLIVNDTNTGDTYFGWGMFEIRNFWVDVQKVTQINETHYQMEMNQGPSSVTYALGDPVYFTVLPRVPNTPEILPADSISIDSIQWISGERQQPVPISGYTASPDVGNVIVCYGPEYCESDERIVVTISGLPPDKQGQFQVNVKATVNNTSDIGSFWFDVSTYQVEASYRVNSWPPLFSNTEYLTVNFTATDFQDNPHNITNVTIGGFFDNKQGRPIKMRYGENYTTDCSLSPDSNFCIIYVTISSLQNGEYSARFSIVDNESIQKTEDVFFKVQSIVVSIPSIEEGWIWETDTVSKKVQNDIRRGQWSECQELRNSVPNVQFFCGQYTPQCEGMCNSVPFALAAPNISYTKEIYGYIPMMEEWSAGRFGSVTNKSRMCMYANGTHMWINTTYDPVNSSCYLIDTQPIAVNDTFLDNKGGVWRLDSLSDDSITITGINTLYKTGILINTSYSKSGAIKLGQIEESNLGAKTMEGRGGIDLNGDSFTNGTVYFAISDNSSSGVYDTFFFSTDGNFTGSSSPTRANPIFVNDLNRANREFGFGQNLTLLNIDPRAQNLRFYSRQIGDWNQLGEVKWNNNITIPLIVASPDGTPRSVNVSVTGYKNMRNWFLNQTNLVSNQNITGIDEIRFNSNLLVGRGEYSFAIRAGDMMEEWKWPLATVRGYLIDGEPGEALYVSNFKPLDIREYRGDMPGIKMTRIQQDARNNTPGFVVDGVLTNAGEINPVDWGCTIFNATNNITDEVLQDSMIYPFMMDYSPLGPDNNGFFFYNSTSQTLYRNTTCWFNISAAQPYQKGSFISIKKDGRTYNLSVLTADRDLYITNSVENETRTFADTNDWQPFGNQGVGAIVLSVVNSTNASQVLPPDSYDWNASHIIINSSGFVPGTYNTTYQWVGVSWRADFGVAGVNSSLILPLVDNSFGDPEWGIQWGYVQNVSIFGTYYDIIFANDTTVYHPRCEFENNNSQDKQCANRAWIVPTVNGNFSSPQARSVTVGQNFTKDLYLAAIGPDDGSGIVVGNFSSLPNLGAMKGPAVGGFQLADSTPSYFNVLDESALGYNLDKNVSTNITFFMLAFDSDFNSQQKLTSNMMDDDLQFLPWSYDTGDQEIKYDFTQTEFYNYSNRTAEQWCDLPAGIQNGCARFGDNDPTEFMWENQPTWDVPFYNNTDMILRKQRWMFGSDQTVDFLVKVFNFNQSAIQGANVTVDKMARSGFSGFQSISKASYSVDTAYNRTDTYGYSLLRITPIQIGSAPAGTWPDGNYQVQLNIQAPAGNETLERWFCVGSCGM